MNSQPRDMYSIKLQMSLYELKQIDQIWYNSLSQYLLTEEGYINDPICAYFFIKKTTIGFTILVVYIDNLNLIKTPKELINTTNSLKKEFEMKDLEEKKILSWLIN